MDDVPDSASTAVSPRVAAVLDGVRERRARRGRRLGPVLWGILAAIALQSLSSRPAPGSQGVALGVTLTLAGCLLPLAAVAAGLWRIVARTPCVTFCLLVSGFGLALGALQSGSVSVLPVSVAVLTAFLVLNRRQAAALAGVVLSGLLTAAAAGADGSMGTLLSQLLFCAVLALMALSLRQAGDHEERAELLLAQLEDAREGEAEAVALAERTRIAQDLHDVLAQTLSGLAIQIQAARRMVRRERTGEELQEVLDRAGELAKEGLGDAVRAVGALRGHRSPSLDRLAELVERYRVDLELDVTLSVTGARRSVPTAMDRALYRGAQEALTNAARYARGARTTVTLCYERERTVLTVEDRRDAPGPTPSPLVKGSGLGLAGMAERFREVGGSASAGPTSHGWRVTMEIPA
ncbi:sensor histidine kinase [Streptomyces sediminimaris]|uniref:sensor histidine kinase n=1 Tax=Streptomyces sediminimaris TaxID=3383721 RepID=UPI003999E09F